MNDDLKVSFYPSELMLPFMKIKADLAEAYSKPAEYYAACDTVQKCIDAALDIINNKQRGNNNA